MADVLICIPAWGEHYRKVAARLTIPALIRALSRVSLSCEFTIYTDDESEFVAIPGFNGTCREVSFAETPHDTLTAIHLRTLQEAQRGCLVGLWNADIIPSEELFLLAALALSAGNSVIASFGLRTYWTKEELPQIPTQTAKQLLDWGWEHRHPSVENCIWTRGKTSFPVTLFFVNGHSSVVAHCSHLHPFIVRKDHRDYNFRGTVDDGLLQLYKDHEIYYCDNRQVGFIEFSTPEKDIPAHFKEVRKDVLDEDFVAEFGKNYLTTHCRNLRQAFRIIGDKPVYSSPAVMLADRIKGNV